MPTRAAAPAGYPLDAALILRHIVAGFLAVDADWTVRVANPKACTLLRRPTPEIEGHSLWEAFPGLGESTAAADLRAAVGGRIERRYEVFSPTLYNWFELWAVPTSDGDLYLFFQDVTDRARAIQSDAVREALRRTLMDAPISITITRGAEHRYELLNQGARALVGGRDLEGMTARNALPEVDSRLFDVLDQVYRTGEPITLRDLEVTYDREGDGTLYTGVFDITYQPMRGADGSVEGLIQTAVETTAYAAARRRLGESAR
jgi:PAS domain-containing protein